MTAIAELAVEVVHAQAKQFHRHVLPLAADAVLLGARIDDVADAAEIEPAWMAERLLAWADARAAVGAMTAAEVAELERAMQAGGADAYLNRTTEEDPMAKCHDHDRPDDHGNDDGLPVRYPTG